MKAFLLLVCIYSIIDVVFGHGRLIEPPSRSSAWRFGFNTPKNYGDNELFCGGFPVQWGQNGGKCGICGDPYNGVRENELPDGIYAKNLVITQNYKRGAIITAKVDLTANHWGYFQFRLCPATTMDVEVTQECLDENLLEVLNSKEKFKYSIPTGNSQIFDVQLKLPNHIICERCVLQWTYTAGNNWGECEDGTFKTGCGRQETFRNCADVRIVGNGIPPYWNTKRPINVKTSSVKPKIITENPNLNEISTQIKCRANKSYRSMPAMDQWCETNCEAGYCPKTHCTCFDNFV